MKTFHAVIATVALAGCAPALPALQTGADPADPAAPAPNAVYVPVTAGATDYRPIEPKSWREMNQRVAPGARRAP